MRSASEEDKHQVLGGSHTYERRLLRFYSWLLETTNFKDVVEIEAIVDAPWVRLCTSSSFQI